MPRLGVPRWTLLLATVTLLLGVVSAGLPALTSWPLTTGTGELRMYLDVLEENNLPTWWATTMLVTGATTSLLVAALHRRTGHPGSLRWAALAALLALLSLDEMTSLHERLDRLVAGRVDLGGYPFLWLAPGAVVGIAVAAGVVLLVRAVPPVTRRWLLLGFALLLGSALGGELVQGLFLAAGDTGPLYVLTYHAEEAGETLGAIAVLAGAASAVVVRTASATATVALAVVAGPCSAAPGVQRG